MPETKPNKGGRPPKFGPCAIRTVRLPKAIWRQVDLLRAREGLSLNEFLLLVLQLDEEDGEDDLGNYFEVEEQNENQ